MVARKQVLGQVASVGEAAFGRLAQNPATHKMLEGVLQGKEWVDRVVHGFESLEQRLAAVEKRLDALEKEASPAPSSRKTTTAKRSAASTKRSAGSSSKP